MSEFELTNENYYSQEANQNYMSVHQYLDFVGSMGVVGCEARALATLKGEYSKPVTEPMLVGSFVDAYFENDLDNFKKNHTEIFTQKGELKSQYRKALRMIERCEEDELFMNFMSGEKQVIMTGTLFGCDWKIKMDSYIPDIAIIDLKTTKGLHDSWKVADYGYVSFVEYYGYIHQLAIYREIVFQNTGKRLPCYIAAVTKEEEPDIEIIGIDDASMKHKLNEIEMNMPSVLAVKNGDYEPTRCERCNYCKATKKLEKAIHYNDLIFGE